MAELTAAQITEACERYVALIGDDDVDALMALYADDCTVEDPAGAEVKRGQDEVRAFYASLPEAGVSATMTGSVRAVAAARTAAFPFRISTGGFDMDAIDVMTFDDEGKITSMVAYWGA